MITLKKNWTLQAVMSGAASTVNPDFVCNYKDLEQRGTEHGTLNGATAVSLATVLTIDGGTRNVDRLVIYNADDAGVTVTVRISDSSVTPTVNRILAKYTLLVGDTMFYANGVWGVTDSTGALKTTGVTTGTVDLNGTADGLILDADGNTTISAPTDDQIDFEIGGADDFTMTANAFNVLTGSAITFADSCAAKFGTGLDITFLWDGTDLLVAQAAADSVIKWGVSGAGINHLFYGDTATLDMTWDQTNNQLLFNDNALLAIGTGAGAAGDITFSWNASKMLVAQLTTNSAIDWGVDGAGIDQVWYGDTASANVTWDQSNDALVFNGVAATLGLRTKSTTAVAITGATALTLADSGGIFSVAQSSAYDVDLPSPTSGPGCRYTFYLTAPGAFNVTLTVLGGAATFVGTIVNDVTSVIPATGATLTFASGVSALGDSIDVMSIATNLYLVRAVTQAAGGITIA